MFVFVEEKKLNNNNNKTTRTAKLGRDKRANVQKDENRSVPGAAKRVEERRPRRTRVLLLVPVGTSSIVTDAVSIKLD